MLDPKPIEVKRSSWDPTRGLLPAPRATLRGGELSRPRFDGSESEPTSTSVTRTGCTDVWGRVVVGAVSSLEVPLKETGTPLNQGGPRGETPSFFVGHTNSSADNPRDLPPSNSANRPRLFKSYTFFRKEPTGSFLPNLQGFEPFSSSSPPVPPPSFVFPQDSSGRLGRGTYVEGPRHPHMFSTRPSTRPDRQTASRPEGQSDRQWRGGGLGLGSSPIQVRRPDFSLGPPSPGRTTNPWSCERGSGRSRWSGKK